MNQQKIEEIINSDLPVNKKSELIKELYDQEHQDVLMFQKGGKTSEEKTDDELFEEFKETLPDNLRNTPEEDYHTRLAWELHGKPKNFQEALKDDMYAWDESDQSYHGNSIAWGDDGVGYFLKPKHHDTVKYELDWFNNGIKTEEGGLQHKLTGQELDDWRKFRNKYRLDDSGEDYKYIPIQKQGGTIDMTIEDILKLNISDSAKSEIINYFKDGGKTDLNLDKLRKMAKEHEVEHSDEEECEEKKKEHHEDPDHDRMELIKIEIIIPAAREGNPTAKRLLSKGREKDVYTFGEDEDHTPGSKASVAIKVHGDYATPSIMEDELSGMLRFIKGNPWECCPAAAKRQSIKFRNPEEAKFFTDHYKSFPDIFPMLLSELLKGDGEAKVIVMQKEGGEVGEGSLPEPQGIITVGDKEYKVCIADTPEERKEGLSKCKSLPEDGGMLFVFDEPVQTSFTMADTSIDLDIVFIDEDGEVIEVHSVKAGDKDPVVCSEEFVYVLEVNYGSGIQEGDVVEFEDIESDEFTEDEKEYTRQNKMLVLDENGDVQYRLLGGERLCSRIFSRKLIKAAIKAYRNDTERDYIKVGKMIMGEFLAQDNRKPQYVESPNKDK